MVPRGILQNHTLAAPFIVIRKALHITSFEVICKSIRVLNDSMWYKGSHELSNETFVGEDDSKPQW